MNNWEDEFKLTKAEERGLLAFFDKINQTKTWPDGSFDAMVAYIDELAEAVLADSTYHPKTHGIANKCRSLVAKARASPNAVTMLDLGTQYGLLMSEIGPEVGLFKETRNRKANVLKGNQKNKEAIEKQLLADYEAAKDKKKFKQKLPDRQKRRLSKLLKK